MKLLGFVDRRPFELAGPLTHHESTARVVSLDDSSGIEKYRFALREGRRQIREYDPDVLISNHPGRLGFLAVVLGRRYRIPVIVRLGGDLWRTNREKLLEHLRKGEYLRLGARTAQIALNGIVVRNVTGYIVVSNELKGRVVEKTGCDPENVQVVYVPQRIETASRDHDGETTAVPSVRVPSGRERVRILTVTNLDFRGKFEGVCDVLREIEPLLESDRDLVYVIAGGGSYYDDLRAYVREHMGHVESRILLPGFVDSVSELYTGSDLFVYVSYIDGYPNVVSEAQAAGLPVIANADHGMIEQIDHGKTGLLVDDPTDGTLRAVVAELIENPDRRRFLGNRAREKIRRENAPERIGRELRRSVERILSNTDDAS